MTIHVIVTCTQRKSRPVPPELHLRHIPQVEPVGRCRQWRRRLADSPTARLTATELYAGEHWQVARSLAAEGIEAGRQVALWVCSAGYGLVPGSAPLCPYAATFSSAQPDSVLRPAAASSDLARWWHELATWDGPTPGQPRTLAALARSDPSAAMLVAVSPPYLRACGRDLAEAITVARDRLAVVCAGGAPAGLAAVALPADARLQATLGGTRGALNVRIAAHLLAAHAGPFTRPALAATMADLLERQPPVPRYERTELDDDAVRRFIAAALKGHHNGSGPACTRLLRRLRDSGYACEQRRFASLYRLVKESS